MAEKHLNPLDNEFLIRFPKTLDYWNEFDHDPSIPVSRPSLKVSLNYDIPRDISIIKGGDFWKYVLLCVRRPAAYRVKFTEQLLKDHHDEWYKIIAPHIFDLSNTNMLENFTLNAFVRFGPDMDAFFLYQAHIKHSKLSFGTGPYLDAVREILCTRCYEQIVDIKLRFKEIYGLDLCENICSKLKGSVKKLFHNILNMPRDLNMHPEDVDIRLFTNNAYYRKNKDTFIEIFSRSSFIDIRKICLRFKKKYNHEIISHFLGFNTSILKKCAKSICRYSEDKDRFFAERINTYALKKDLFGIMRLVICRCEVDLTNIMDEFKKRYKKLSSDNLRSLFSQEMNIYNNIFKPLCGM